MKRATIVLAGSSVEKIHNFVIRAFKCVGCICFIMGM